jgi:hypothetical protein
MSGIGVTGGYLFRVYGRLPKCGKVVAHVDGHGGLQIFCGGDFGVTGVALISLDSQHLCDGLAHAVLCACQPLHITC